MCIGHDGLIQEAQYIETKMDRIHFPESLKYLNRADVEAKEE